MLNPKITVLMPAYNTGKYIHEAISSVLDQTFTDFELLIINDGSTDDTLAIINTFTDARIRVINQDNKGVANALNNGLNNAHAPYIARFDADDVCYPNRLQVQYDLIMAHPDYSIIGSACDYADVNGEYVFTYQPPAYSNAEIQQLDYKICPFIHSGVFYKKDVVLNAGGYNEYAYTFEDHFLWANILKNEKACNLQQSLIKVRWNPESITIDEKWRTNTFRKIKYNTLNKLAITQADGIKLRQIGKQQHSTRIKEGAYYALLGKKYLWNNYQPVKARQNLIKTLSINPLHIRNYFLLLLSFLPEKMLRSFYHSTKPNYRPNKTKLSAPLLTSEELTYGS
jgi:glycosyltransferase involved in cell wall biosynthesis